MNEETGQPQPRFLRAPAAGRPPPVVPVPRGSRAPNRCGRAGGSSGSLPPVACPALPWGSDRSGCRLRTRSTLTLGGEERSARTRSCCAFGRAWSRDSNRLMSIFSSGRRSRYGRGPGSHRHARYRRAAVPCTVLRAVRRILSAHPTKCIVVIAPRQRIPMRGVSGVSPLLTAVRTLCIIVQAKTHG